MDKIYHTFMITLYVVSRDFFKYSVNLETFRCVNIILVGQLQVDMTTFQT